jgi:cell division protein FtsZ
MIELTAQHGPGKGRSIKILGVGGAGANALDRLALDGVNPAHLIAVNTDAQALVAGVAGVKIQLGKTVTRGLGSGGDPDLGRSAAQEATGELRAALDGVEGLFLLAGLGGGTGSGAAPVVAELARDAGILVIAVVTLPFFFEGKRRLGQAAEALAAINEYADAVVCFENDRMADAVSPKAGIQQTFAAADQTISQSVQAIVALLSRNGLIHLGFDDFRAALHPGEGKRSRCLFGYGEATGDNRPYDALARALKNPLMDKGRLLRDCDSVLVQVSGGPELTLNEVQLLMVEFNRQVGDHTRILFGAAVDPALAGRIAVTILSSVGAEESAAATQPLRPKQPEAVPRLAPQPVVAPVPAAAPAPAAETKLRQEAEILDLPKPESDPESEPQEVLETVEALEASQEIPCEPELPATTESFVECNQIDTEEQLPEVESAVPAPLPPTRPSEKPSRLRPFGSASQRSLFGDPPVPEPVQPLQEPVTPSRERVIRPIPGRTLQTAAVRASRQGPEPAEPTPEPPAQPKADGLQEPATPAVAPKPQPVHQEELPSVPAAAKPVAIPSPAIPKRPGLGGSAAPAAPELPAAPKTPQQETLQFEPVTRGRFEKSEPTIVDGQDLDVPTFLRRNIRVR